jgi:hypothetical protein
MDTKDFQIHEGKILLPAFFFSAHLRAGVFG